MATPRSLAPPLREGLELRCAALSLGGINGCLWNEAPPELRVRLGRLGERSRDVERAGFAAWLDEAVVPGSTPQSRYRAVVAGVRGAARELPDDLHLVEPARLDGAGFASPREWAEAEWRLTWEEAARALAHDWEERLEEALEGSDEVYLFVGRDHPERDPWEREVAALVGGSERSGTPLDWGKDANLESAAAVVSVLPYRLLTSEEVDRVREWTSNHARVLMRNGEPEILVRAPIQVARWLEGALFSELCVQLTNAEADDDERVVEVALALWEPGSAGPLKEPAAAFDAARDVLRR